MFVNLDKLLVLREPYVCCLVLVPRTLDSESGSSFWNIGPVASGTNAGLHLHWELWALS